MRERTGLPCLVLGNDLDCGSLRVWSGLTSKSRIVLRVCKDCLLNSRRWFCVEAYWSVRLCFRMRKLCRSPSVCPTWLPKGIYMEVYQCTWLTSAEMFEER